MSTPHRNSIEGAFALIRERDRLTREVREALLPYARTIREARGWSETMDELWRVTTEDGVAHTFYWEWADEYETDGEEHRATVEELADPGRLFVRVRGEYRHVCTDCGGRHYVSEFQVPECCGREESIEAQWFDPGDHGERLRRLFDAMVEDGSEDQIVTSVRAMSDKQLAELSQEQVAWLLGHPARRVRIRAQAGLAHVDGARDGASEASGRERALRRR